jgi:Pectate lyase superfamily protein
MKTLFLALTFSAICFSQSTTYYPTGSTNPSNPTFCYPEPSCATRSFTNVLSDFVSVKDFGAVGNGVTDDTVAIQNTINASSAGLSVRTVFFPQGTYAISSPLQLNVAFDFLEFAKANLLITCSSCSAIQVTAPYVTVSNINIIKSAGTTGVIAVEINPNRSKICDGFTFTNGQINGNSTGDQFANGIYFHSGLNVGPVCNGICTDDHSLIDYTMLSFCGTCLEYGDTAGTGLTGVNYAHIRDVTFTSSTSGKVLNNSSFMSGIGTHFINISGTAITIAPATLGNNHDNSITNMEFVNNTANINIGAGAAMNTFQATTINHALITDAGTSTTYVSAAELTNGTSSLINGHIAAIGASPTITTCTSGTVNAGSTDAAGGVTTTSGPVTCIMGFAVNYASAPHCSVTFATNPTSTPSITYNTNNIAVVITGGVPSFNYICMGR